MIEFKALVQQLVKVFVVDSESLFLFSLWTFCDDKNVFKEGNKAKTTIPCEIKLKLQYLVKLSY
jgi:hypothetical protein